MLKALPNKPYIPHKYFLIYNLQMPVVCLEEEEEEGRWVYWGRVKALSGFRLLVQHDKVNLSTCPRRFGDSLFSFPFFSPPQGCIPLGITYWHRHTYARMQNIHDTCPYLFLGSPDAELPMCILHITRCRVTFI